MLPSLVLTTIATVHLSDYGLESPLFMDVYMMNADIQAVLLQNLDCLLFIESFKSEFPKHAKHICSRTNVGDLVAAWNSKCSTAAVQFVLSVSSRFNLDGINKK